MEQVAMRLRKTDGWTYLGGKPDARKEPSVVIRAIEGDVRFTTGSAEDAPDGEEVLVPEGEGRRLTGRHFFLRPAPPEGPRLVLHRGLEG